MRVPTVPVLALLLAACGSLGFEAEVTDKEVFVPPPVYSTWWEETQVCSERSGDFDRITWYLASTITGDGAIARGRWTAPHEIILVKGYEGDPKTVKHEMLHDLLGGDREHGAPAWAACDLLFG